MEAWIEPCISGQPSSRTSRLRGAAGASRRLASSRHGGRLLVTPERCVRFLAGVPFDKAALAVTIRVLR